MVSSLQEFRLNYLKIAPREFNVKIWIVSSGYSTIRVSLVHAKNSVLSSLETLHRHKLDLLTLLLQGRSRCY